MSAEASTSTASTSGASAGGSDYSSSDDEFEKYCYSFSLEQVMLIKRLAKAEAQFPKLSKKTNDKRHQHAAQKKVVDELQDILDGLYGAMHWGLEISELAELEAELLKQREILEKIEEELSVCSINSANKIDETSHLHEKLKKQPLIGSSSIADHHQLTHSLHRYDCMINLTPTKPHSNIYVPVMCMVYRLSTHNVNSNAFHHDYGHITPC
ncbi:hypothetical protein BATDEDRAFT_87171 [Batrachochytrium dendrobatidis JAM81]|uniref:Uncharacterized protein n=1 Tax=Batrachochytrium dendrobatidis (strain JAM81 / FGSC 10211) TaxID=684364 RepID=F4NYI3_BATDJ|nr:uncharacterized protein BATDEDRAFT_87171 [Batrachochytrium dendrobatidis JAM81]EGF82028.1 hypothetical protein BATDEDRAFT_87171 [Batrachochytrium dendrobatidis JAM81]|eukprot:XP_006677611.1 hypothetical protein BATDEDRAFT_87171 [Batrachochytrium dendrobatidis JAM81]